MFHSWKAHFNIFPSDFSECYTCEIYHERINQWNEFWGQNICGVKQSLSPLGDSQGTLNHLSWFTSDVPNSVWSPTLFPTHLLTFCRARRFYGQTEQSCSVTCLVVTTKLMKSPFAWYLVQDSRFYDTQWNKDQWDKLHEIYCRIKFQTHSESESGIW